MIGQISPLDSSTQGLGSMGGVNGSSPAPANGLLVGPSAMGPSSMADAVSAMQINTAVGQLLQGIGGGAESNRMLQMLIGLLILMTLLQGPQGGSSAAGGLDDLAKSGAGQGGYLGVSMSSTTVTIEQTSVVYSNAQVSETDGASQSQGKELDLAA